VTLLTRLFLLVAVALLPAIAIQVYNEIDLRRLRQVEVQDEALGLAKLASAEQQQIVRGIRQVLIALSELPAIKSKDGAACDRYFGAIKQQYPAFITFAVADINGDYFCDTNSLHHPLTAAGRVYFAEALKTGAFTVGRFSIGRSTGRNVVQFALPFYDNDGRMAGGIIAALSLDWLADHIARQNIPPGAALTIADDQGTYLARYPDNAPFVGKRMADTSLLAAEQPGTADILDVDGVERIVGYSTLRAESGGFFVTLGLDKAEAFAPIQRRALHGMLLIALSTGLVLMFMWFGARRFIHRPLGQLVDAANQWRLGDYARRVDIHHRQSEIARVGDALNTMAEALQTHERDLREAKDRAERATARIMTAFESTTDSVILVDRDWRIRYLNERAKLQISDGRDLIGADLWAAFPEAVRSNIYSQYRMAASEQRPTAFETFSRERNTWYEINAFPSSQGLAVYFRDITAQKRALETRRSIEEQLRQSQKMEAVGQLTGGVAHDFNNLLTVVSGNLALIEESAGDGDSVRQFAAAASQAAHRGAKLTAQLLAFSRRQVLDPETVYPDKLVCEFLPLLRRAVGEGCQIRLRTDELVWPCHVDPAQLETALLNLTLNGRDAMPNGGVVEITIRNAIVEGGDVAGLAPGSYVTLSVADTGDGIAPAVLDRVFEPFFTTKEVGKGTGLGLSMVYGFVNQSGGHVTIASEVGTGTTVTLYLPRAPADTKAEPETVKVQVASPAGLERVLVVEDDEQVMDVTSAMLTGLGYRILCAPNATEAIAILKGGEALDLLFSDLGLPGMNGIDLAREARRLRPGLKVLLTSGYTADILARDRGPLEFPIVRKPFYKADLARSLRAALEGIAP
jgi:signal transduction histidine kinase/HAMP domain-containing protein